jgi:hypothetical protein
MSKRLKTSILLSTALLPIVSGVHTAFAQVPTPSYSVTIDGNPIEFGDSPPISQNGRVLVPLRAIFEALGAKVSFSNGVISAQRGQTNLQLTLGSTQALVGDQMKTLDVAAQAVNGKTLVPLRFIGEALGAGVSFNGATSSIAITSPRTSGGGGNDLSYTVPGSQTINGTVVRVDNTNPPRIVVAVDGQLRTFNVGANVLTLRQVSVASSLSETPIKQGAKPIQFSTLSPGNDVRLTLDSGNNVIQILTSTTIIIARVQYAGGNQIILADENDTTLTIGETISYIDSNGREARTANLNAGQNVALFLSRETRSIYRISSYAPDLVVPGGNANTTPDPLPGGIGSPNTPRLTLVETDATGPFKTGSRLTVTARATAGQVVTFSVGTKIQNVAMNEIPDQPGNYRGTYTVKRGDDVLEARVTARLMGASNFEDTLQSENAITIDTIAPRLIGSFPSDGARINVARPNIVIFADDLGGSGLSSATIELVTGSAANPTRTNVPATVAPPTSINAVPPIALSGNVRVNATILDKAGNPLTTSFSFNVTPTTVGTVNSITHGATRAVISGEEVPIELRSTPGGGAAFEVRSNTGAILARDIPMIEDNEDPGRYTATYRIPDGVTGPLRVTGKFTPGDGTFTTSETTAPINVLPSATPTKLTVESPANGSTAQNPLILRGKAAPNAQVEVNITALGTQLYVFEYREDLGKSQVRADANGNWQTAPINLPTRKNIAGLSYSITVTQTDGVQRESEPVTLTLKGR